MTLERQNVGILVFDDVEVLDFAGPYEVFSRTRLEVGTESRRSYESAPFRVFTVASTKDPIRATGGLQVIPDHGFVDAPRIDILVVPGGFGTRELLDDATTLDWIRAVSESAARTTSVCTGSLLLARLGLLRNRRATTHWGALEMLSAIDASIDVRMTERVVEDGPITSAGVSSGIDMAFYLVEKLCGREVADETARYIEYPRR